MSVIIVNDEPKVVPFRDLVKAQSITRNVYPSDDQWWEDDFKEGETSWEDREGKATSSSFTTIHHREITLIGDEGINPPGNYTQMAVVTRSKSGKPRRVIVSTGKKVEILTYLSGEK